MRSPLGHIEKLGDRHWRVRVEAGRDPITGQRIRLSRNVRGTKADAKRAEAELLARVGASAVSLGRLSLVEFVNLYWLPTKQDLRATTLSGYRALIDTHITSGFGSMRLEAITPHKVQTVLNALPSRETAQHVHALLKTIFNYAVAVDAIDRSPLRGVERPRSREYVAEVYALEQVPVLLDYWRDDRMEAAVLLALSCGIRRSENVALDCRDVKLFKRALLTSQGEETEFGGELTVSKGMHAVDGELVTYDPKSRSSRRVLSIPGFAAERLIELRVQERVGPLTYLLDGTRMPPGTMTARWRKRMLHEDCPLPYIPFKNLRHTHTTVLLSLGAPIEAVSRRDGHSDISITDSFYNRPGRVVDVSTAEKMDAGVRGIVVEFESLKRASDSENSR